MPSSNNRAAAMASTAAVGDQPGVKSSSSSKVVAMASKAATVAVGSCLDMHILSYMSKFTRILFHLAALCDSLRCGAYGTYCYGIS